MEKISLVMVVKDHPSRIYDAIESTRDLVSEIVLIDIGIHDKLKKTLSKSHIFHLPHKIIDLKRDIPYVELIREEMKQHATYDYVLFLDEDEVLTDGLKKILLENIGKYDYFAIPRKNIIFNKFIQNSRWWPDYNVRLFKKSKVTWPKIIHSQPELSGNGFVVPQEERFALVHYNYDSIDHYVSKAIRYAKAQAEEKLIAGEEFTLRSALTTSLSEFVSRFFSENGFKDGIHGLILALFQTMYSWLVYAYYWEGKKYFTLSEKEVVENASYLFKQGTIETDYWIAEKNLQKNPLTKIKSVIIKRLLQ